MTAFERDFRDLHGQAWPPGDDHIVLEARPVPEAVGYEWRVGRAPSPLWAVRRPSNPLPWGVRAGWALMAVLIVIMLGVGVLTMLAIAAGAVAGQFS